jgi:radical S-adenosyl methionine domain-containing protein 2
MKAHVLGAHRFPFTANFHFIKSCNFGCRYCYATFADVPGRTVLPDTELIEVAGLLGRHFSKVTFVGGEPTLHPHLRELLDAARAGGALINVVTNGSRIDASWLAEHADVIDFLTISVDSDDRETHRKMGRAFKDGTTLPSDHLGDIAQAARDLDIRVKVNTVVTTENMREDLSGLIARLAPTRWKILQAAPVEGQNDQYIDELTPPDACFKDYVTRHRTALGGVDIRIVDESVDVIRGSYLMVDPRGRFFDSASGCHRYSDPILEVGIHAAVRQVDFDDDKFAARDGAADWRASSRGTSKAVDTAKSSSSSARAHNGRESS